MDRVVYCIANRQNVLGGVRVITCHHVIRRLSSELHVSRSHPQAVCIRARTLYTVAVRCAYIIYELERALLLLLYEYY